MSRTQTVRKPATRAERIAEADRRLMRGAAAMVGFVFDMAPTALLRDTRGPGMEAEARQLMLAVVRRAKAMTPDPSSIQRIGKAINRDRTTVAHALHKVERAAEQSDPLDALVDKLAAMLCDGLRLQDLAHDLLSAGIEAGVGPDDDEAHT